MEVVPSKQLMLLLTAIPIHCVCARLDALVETNLDTQVEKKISPFFLGEETFQSECQR